MWYVENRVHAHPHKSGVTMADALKDAALFASIIWPNQRILTDVAHEEMCDDPRCPWFKKDFYTAIYYSEQPLPVSGILSP